jgi:hypothetical protein
MIYVRLVEPSVAGTAAKQGQIEQVYSPDDATAFPYGDAHYFRQQAFEHWSNFNWEIEKVSGDKYRVRAGT